MFVLPFCTLRPALSPLHLEIPRKCLIFVLRDMCRFRLKAKSLKPNKKLVALFLIRIIF